MQKNIDYKTLDFVGAREYFQGKNIVFTGRGFLTRSELTRLVRQAGANVDSVVTKKCDILIVGDKPGSKLRKAMVLGCKIISTNEFKDILEGKILKEIYDNEELVNINLKNDKFDVINIIGKHIYIDIKNEVLKTKTINSINKNGGCIIDDFQHEKIDILIYQPHSNMEKIINKAKERNIIVFTVGKFNRMLLNSEEIYKK